MTALKDIYSIAVVFWYNVFDSWFVFGIWTVAVDWVTCRTCQYEQSDGRRSRYARFSVHIACWMNVTIMHWNETCPTVRIYLLLRGNGLTRTLWYRAEWRWTGRIGRETAANSIQIQWSIKQTETLKLPLYLCRTEKFRNSFLPFALTNYQLC